MIWYFLVWFTFAIAFYLIISDILHLPTSAIRSAMSGLGRRYVDKEKVLDRCLDQVAVYCGRDKSNYDAFYDELAFEDYHGTQCRPRN